MRAALAAALLPLAGCAAVSDTVSSVSGWFRSDKDEPSQQVAAKPDAGIVARRPIDPDQPYPNLSSVPEPPKPTLDPAQRGAMLQDLESDRRTARQEDAALRRAVPAPPGSGGTAGLPPAPVESLPLPAAPPPAPPAAVTMAPPAAPEPGAPPARAGVATQPGVRYAIPPRPPVAPPQPLSVRQSAARSSGLSAEPAPIQLAAAAEFFGLAATAADGPLLRASESLLPLRGPVAPPAPLSARGLAAAESPASLDGAAVAAARRAIDRPPAVSAQVASLAFPNGEAALTPAQRAQLREVALLQRRHGGRLWVVGHASHRTPDMPLARHKLVNYRLSVDRAAGVVAALRGFGVPADAISMSARSDWDPVYHEVMPAGEAENRRVEIYLEY